MHWPGHRLALGLALAVLVLWFAVRAITVRLAALPASASGPMLVAFEPGTSEDRIFGNIIAAGARPVRSTWLGFVWVVAGDAPGLAGRLAERGALGAYTELPFSPTLAGCFAYADSKTVELFSLRP
jgi:hypothetical protein